jgi:hypothetical protein
VRSNKVTGASVIRSVEGSMQLPLPLSPKNNKKEPPQPQPAPPVRPLPPDDPWESIGYKRSNK